LALLAWMGLVLVLSTIPPGEVPFDLFTGSDKVGHAAFYMVLGALAARVRGRSAPGKIWLAAFGLAAAYGGLIEVAQAVVGREPSLADWGADAVGAAVGAGAGLVGTRTSEEAG